MGSGIPRRTFLSQTAASLGLLGIDAGTLECVRAADAAGLAAPSARRHLFLDDREIASETGLHRVLHQPTKYDGNPVIAHDQRPWQGFRCQLYGTALYDERARRTRLWYLAVPRLPFEEPVVVDGRSRVPNFQLVGYAESTNGYDFELPSLGLVDFNGSKDNNLCRIGRECVEGLAVVFDPREPDDERRYKALYWEHLVPLANSQGIGVDGICVSFSPDGKRWTDHSHNPVLPYSSDTGQQVVFDAQRNQFVAYGRFGADGRRVARSESRDFINWSVPRVVLEADARDAPGTQVYGMGVSYYEGIYLGLPWMFHEGTSHQIDVQLAMSRDGVRWDRLVERQTFLPNGLSGAWDAGIIFTASQPLVVHDDTIFIYYSACEHNHDFRHRPRRESPQWNPYWESLNTSIGVATLRRDGFVSIEPHDATGRLVTKSFHAPASERLHLNLDAAAGQIQVAISKENATTPIAQATIERVDHTDHVVRWPEGVAWPSPGEPIRLEFTLNRSRLYSYWFAPADHAD